MSMSRDKMPESGSDPTKDAEFGRVVDHFLNTPTHPKAKPEKPRKERPASKGRVRKGKSRS
jgi:hypothetical protein